MAKGLRVIFQYSVILLLIRVSYQIEFSNNSELISNEKHYYKAKNSTGVEIHFVLDFLKGQKSPYDDILRIPTTQRSIEAERDLENVLSEVLNGQWSNKYLLLELAELTKDLNARIKIFTVLWKNLQSSKKIYNPFELITLYQQLEMTLPTTLALTYTQAQLNQIEQIKLELRNALTTRSSQILQAAAYIPNNLQNTTLKIVLQRLNELQDTIFVETLDKIYDAVEGLVTLEQLSLVVSNFSINIKQKVIANLQLLERLRNSTRIKVKTTLIDNLKELVNEDGFGKLTPEWRIRVNNYLPQSMRNLYSATKLCIRNATNPTKYLYECPQTYLMCTNAKQLQQAAFLVDRNDAGLFAFRSIYWANRYIRLEGSNTTGNVSTSFSSSTVFTKNIYSKHGASYWHVNFNGDYAFFMDPTSRIYLCGGNSEAWNGGEQHVYTRNVASYVEYQQECQWFIEDCGTVAKYF